MPTHFKLKFDDLTRRASFAKQPSWSELSDKISNLYAVPQHQVGVTYIDGENEEITLNTEEELQDYYFSSYRPGETIKFSVRDLTSRNQRPPIPASTGARNTFGQFVDPEIPGLDEWHAVNNIPSLEEILGQSSSTSDVRSAFVESVPSDGSTVGKAGDNTFGAIEPVAGDAHSEISQPRIPSDEKGKERAHSIRSVSSTQSLLAADVGDKHPVHVYDVSARIRSPFANESSFDEAGEAIVAESTPRAPTSSLQQNTPRTEQKPDQAQETDDPPLPSLEAVDLPVDTAQTTQSPEASANLARDVASFLNTISNLISSHPEVGESLRTIVRNTANGTYWASHREALSQAAAELQRNAETLAEDGRQAAEEGAGRRVADALAGVLRIFSQAQAEGPRDTQGHREAETQHANTTTDPSPQQANTADAPLPTDTNPRTTESSQTQIPTMPGAFSEFDANFGGSFPFGHRPGWHHGWRARASMPPAFGLGGGFPGWAMPPIPPPFGPGVLNATGTSGPRDTTPFFTSTTAPSSDPRAKPDQPTTDTTAPSGSHERLTPQELKAKVEEAKRAYKAEKERYRREKDERKMERSMKRDDTTIIQPDLDGTTSPGEIGHIAVNARHDFPRFDIINVTDSTPRRQNTHLGHFPRRHERPAEDLFTRAVNRISRRLADMGFTEKAYPDLPQKIKNYLPGDGAITKENEDDIVTTLLEAMLTAPKSPVASGSGARDIPGGWH